MVAGEGFFFFFTFIRRICCVVSEGNSVLYSDVEGISAVYVRLWELEEGFKALVVERDRV